MIEKILPRTIGGPCHDYQVRYEDERETIYLSPIGKDCPPWKVDETELLQPVPFHRYNLTRFYVRKRRAVWGFYVWEGMTPEAAESLIVARYGPLIS